jgi:flavin-binding protein dodecin
MSVAKVIEITARHPKGFEQAISEGIARATETIDDIRSAWVSEQHVDVENGRIVGYRVNLRVVFVLKGGKGKKNK